MAYDGNPYFATGPALISFSGGRTSAYMLKQIIDAHGGTLPDDVHVCFANTGKEREETLRFVHECATRWGVRIHWLEWRSRRKAVPVGERFEEVGFNSAARNGEPFKALISDKKAVPNAVQRWCTTHLKWQCCADFMAVQGYTAWTNIVGLRADEPERTIKKKIDNATGGNTWTHSLPLEEAGVSKADVLRFWLGDTQRMGSEEPQGFDLRLNPWEGNCTKCMMKGRKLLMWEVRRDLADAQDWAAMEKVGGATFTTEWSMNDLIRDVQRSPLLPLDPQDEEFDAECGTWCTSAVRIAA
jgi:3'-phosphoadenosine 5'-phosphosulfate sulfotransferase (PAPS reductase)/FAD synthetase